MKNLKIIIYAVIIIIIFIIITLIFLLNNKNSGTEIKDLPDDSIPQDIIINASSELKRETNDYKFFAISDFIDKFLQYVNSNNQVAIKSILDKTYTKEFDIRKFQNNIRTFYAQTMYKQENQKYSIYYVEGYIELINETNYLESYYEIFVDNENMRASIIPLTDEQYNQCIKNAKIIEDKEIQENEYNKYEELSLSNWNLAERYLNDYILKVKYNIEAAYDILDNLYRERKFSNNIEEFKKYILDNKERFNDINIINCVMKLKEQGIEYNITDSNNNTYIIERKNAMEYTMILDNKTI